MILGFAFCALIAALSGQDESAQQPLPLRRTAPPSIAKAAAALQRIVPETRLLTVRQIDSVYMPVTRPRGLPNPRPTFECSNPPYSGWHDNAPPNCDPSGTFVRTFTKPGRAAAEAIISLPDNIYKSGPIELPTAARPPAVGFVYIEGWPGPKTSNSEGGLHYNAGSDKYTLYIAVPGVPEQDVANWTVRPNSLVYLRVGSDENAADTTTLPRRKAPKSCKPGCIELIVAVFDGNCSPGVLCIDRQLELSPGWKANCCIFGRMTSIGTPMQYSFSGGYKFGPITWSSLFTETKTGSAKYRFDGCQGIAPLSTPSAPAPFASPAGSPCAEAQFFSAGTQAYPRMGDYVQRSVTSDGAETVTILNPKPI